MMWDVWRSPRDDRNVPIIQTAVRQDHRSREPSARMSGVYRTELLGDDPFTRHAERGATAWRDRRDECHLPAEHHA